MNNTCNTCKHWRNAEKEFRDEVAGGFCNNKKITESFDIRKRDWLVYSYNEGGSFWTGPDFGCIHHKTKRGKA